MEEQPEPAAAEAGASAPVAAVALSSPAPVATEDAAAEVAAVETEAAAENNKEDDAEEAAPTAEPPAEEAKFLPCRPPAAKAAWDALKAAEAAAAPEQGKVDAVEVAKIAHQHRKVGVEEALVKVPEVERAIGEDKERGDHAFEMEATIETESQTQLEADLKVRCRERPQVYHSHSVWGQQCTFLVSAGHGGTVEEELLMEILKAP